MKRTKVERVARKLIEECGLTRESGTEEAFVPLTSTILEKLARFHLREVRKARGRTVGWVGVLPQGRSPAILLSEDASGRRDAERERPKLAEKYLAHSYNDVRVARVVLAPARRKGGRR